MSKFKFEFDDIVEHKNIRFIGKITGRAEYSNGCKLYGVRLKPSEHPRRQNYRWLSGDLLKLHKEK